ncbi:MAG: zf-TFIIB domain-containing protein [Xanthomonadales bacterium]|nr:zf-TFIIB domain-containing protein [Gammaproteobacteria bacterium]NNE05651.1 zf-TFIIB domain-containing protein [Xanthomonadales bacterium]NNL96176.1 zf-TFIIB domain-containing protein [Xanthomonadales bacterium]
MDKRTVEDIEVDRCQICKGLWFDAGEAEALRNRSAAGRIDTGDAWEGKQLDFIRNYNCPRCGGRMINSADTRQKHIHFETCENCEGSFFDAGEFLDLSSRSISDLLKKFISRNRD